MSRHLRGVGPQNWNFPYGNTADKSGKTCVHKKTYVSTLSYPAVSFCLSALIRPYLLAMDSAPFLTRTGV